MKQRLLNTIFLWICTLVTAGCTHSFCSADFQLNVTIGRESTVVPVGNVLVKVDTETGNRVSTNGTLGTIGVSLPSNAPITVTLQPRAMALTPVRGATTEGNDLTFNSTFSPQTIVKSYRRDSVALELSNLQDKFTVTANSNIGVEFGLAELSTAKEYQFYFRGDVLPAWDNTNLANNLGRGRFYVTNPQNSFTIPWSVIAHLGTGNNLFATVRFIDNAMRYDQIGFEFDVTPMGGGAAIPEPSTWWMIGFLASCFAGRGGWKWWRARIRAVTAADTI